MRLLNKFFMSLSTMLSNAKNSSEAKAIVKMKITIARLQQIKPVRRFDTGYLE